MKPMVRGKCCGSFHLVAPLPTKNYLLRVGRRTHYWIIYTVDEESRTVDVLSFWNTARDPDSIDL
jgi:mRNA-degrading endonuclease RelE of RelBE toxin-antitoxin system